jgi:signal transduction histidine kinase
MTATALASPTPREPAADTVGMESRATTLARTLQAQTELIRLITAGTPASQVLSRLAELVETVVAGAYCAVQILDPARVRVIDTVAPRLASGFLHAVNEAELKAQLSPATRAITRRQPVIVADIEQDDPEPRFRQVAAAYDLQACWAQPIPNRKGKPAGALMLCFRTPRAPTRAEADIVAAFVASASLVVDHGRRALALRSADQRFASLAASVPGVVYQRTVGPTGEIRYTYISEGARELFGVAPEAILSDPNALFDCHSSSYRENFRSRLLKASEEMSLWDVEATIISRDGKRKFTHAIARPHREADGTVVWDGIILDATRIKEAELRSAETEARTRSAIVESLPQGFLMFDAADRLTLSNAVYGELYPASRAVAVPGASYASVVRAELAASIDSADIEARLEAHLAQHRQERSAREQQLADGRSLLINEHRTQDGGTVVLHTDVTELRKRELELLRSNRELQDFATVASHDLQEPLRKIEAFGDRLRSRHAASMPEDGKLCIERMQAASGRMRALINDLLSYSRVTTKARPFAACDLDAIAKGVLSDLQVRIEEADARVEVEGLPTIDADATQMSQLLLNLVSNALKFRAKETAPVVRVEGRVVARGARGAGTDAAPGEQVELVVADNGIGFDMKYADRIFSIFQRLHGRNEYEGTGIGLATCRKIVERHGGRIAAQSEPGKGATFTITLPVRQKQAGAKP